MKLSNVIPIIFVTVLAGVLVLVKRPVLAAKTVSNDIPATITKEEALNLVRILPETQQFIENNHEANQEVGFEVTDAKDNWAVEGYMDYGSNRGRWNNYLIAKTSGKIVWSWIQYDKNGDFICFSLVDTPECDPRMKYIGDR